MTHSDQDDEITENEITETENEKFRTSFLYTVGLYSGVGIQLVILIVMGLFGGSFLDRKLGTTPWLLLGGVVFGTATGFYNLVRILNAQSPHTTLPPGGEGARRVGEGSGRDES